MNTQESLQKLDRLVKEYNDTSNRQIVTLIRTLIAKLLNSNPLLQYRIKELLDNNRISL